MPKPKRALIIRNGSPSKGRPTVRTTEIAQIICEVLADGGSTKEAAKKAGIATSTIRDWASEDEHFAAILARAKRDWSEAMAEEGQRIAAEPPRMITTEDGERVDSGWVQHITSRLNYMKWLIGKRDPARFGDTAAQTNVAVGVSVSSPKFVINAPESFFEDRTE